MKSYVDKAALQNFATKLTAKYNSLFVRHTNGASGMKIWTGTQAQYDAIVTKDNNTLYYIVETSA